MSTRRKPAASRLIVSGSIAAILVGVVIWFAADVILLIFAAVLLAVLLHGPADWLARRSRLSRGSSLLVVLLVLLTIFGGVAWLIVPRVAAQVERLSQTLPSLLRDYAGELQQYAWGEWLLAQSPSFGEVLGSMGSLVAAVGGFFSTTLGAFITPLLVVVLGLYFAFDSETYVRGLTVLLPKSKRERAREVLDVVAITMRGWLLGQLFSMTFLAVFAFIGLSILGVPLALTLALFTGLLTFIPNIGPITSVILPFLLALSEDPWKALYVLLFYLVLQSGEGYFLTPMVMRYAVRLPPALLLTMQIVLSLLLGFFGLLLAAPIVAVGMVLVKLLYLEDVLGEPVRIPGYSGRGVAA